MQPSIKIYDYNNTGNYGVRMEKTFTEFFAGIGLVRLGLQTEGWKCLFANDNDSEKVRIYKNNFGLKEINNQYIEKLKATEVPEAMLATASFPCQDLSEAGPQKGLHGPRSGLFWTFVKILDEMKNKKPYFVLLENVRGFLTSKGGDNVIQAVTALNKLGYTCDVLIIDGKYFVPQSRPRVFIIGFLGEVMVDSEETNPLVITDHDHVFRPRSIQRLMKENSTLRWHNFNLPEVTSNSVKLGQILEPSDKVPKSYWFEEELVKKHEKMFPPKHKEIIDKLKARKGNGVFTMYRRMRKGEQKAELRFDGLAGCLRTGSGGSSKQFLVVVENGQLRMRKFTISELKRLMGIRLGFYLPEEYCNAYKALGDAVVVPEIEWLAKNILNPMFENFLKS